VTAGNDEGTPSTQGPFSGQAGHAEEHDLAVSHGLGESIAGATRAHRRLEQTVDGIDDEVARRPTTLPGWTVGHVLTHLARNADSHARMLDAASDGRAVEQYAGGYEQRSADIEVGAGRSAAELVDDVRASIQRLEGAWERMTPRAWHGHGFANGAEWPCRVMPFHRWREVELHHVDLGLGYSPDDWPLDYVRRELELAAAALPERADGSDAAALLAWLVGRSDETGDIRLAPWQTKPEHYHMLPSFLADLDTRLVTVFRSRLREEAKGEYDLVALEMASIARTMPGFLELKTFTADDGERVSVVTFANQEAQSAWRDHPDHRVAQQLGRSNFYDSYDIQICRVVSERSFRRQVLTEGVNAER